MADERGDQEPPRGPSARGLLTGAEFARLLAAYADALRRGDAHAAADCFADDAVYVEPPDRQVYRGRAELLELFSPGDGMTLVWRHTFFDEATGTGAGEYTFEGRNRYHGVALVKVARSKIVAWREYQYQSDLDWEEFVGDAGF